MKIRYTRTHTVRPIAYESVMLHAAVDIDLENEVDAEFRDLSHDEIGERLSAVLDDLLDSDVRRTLRLPGEHIEDSHIWEFYDYDTKN